MKKNDIVLFIVNSEMKASVVERFNRTLKEKMFRYFTATDANRYIDILQDLVAAYNNTYHRSIKTTPNSVTETNEDKIRNVLYKDETNELLNFKFRVGDYVRMSKYKSVFQKGYTKNWTEEKFQIIERIPRKPPVYRIKDLANDIIEGFFYETELQKVDYQKDEIVKIEEIIKSKKNKKDKSLTILLAGEDDQPNLIAG